MKRTFQALKERAIAFLWEADPGYLHLRQGARTLLAALITLLCLNSIGLYTRVLACFAAGLVCQGIVGSHLREQKICFGISSLATLAYFSLISYISPFPLPMAITIVIASFSVFAIRNLGSRYFLFPLFTWIMGFMTSIFPRVTGFAFLERLSSLGIACVISFVVYFYLLPPRYLNYFFKNMRFFIALVHSRTLKLERHLKSALPFPKKEIDHFKLRRSLRKYYLHNQNILSSFDILESAHKNDLLHILSNHYLAGKALLILQDNLMDLSETSVIKTLEIEELLCQALKDLRDLTQAIQIDSQALSIKLQETPLSTPESFKQLKQILEQSSESPRSLIPFYHLIVSLNDLYDRLLALSSPAPKALELQDAQ